MTAKTTFAFVLAALACAAAPAFSATVQVEFVKPESFSDAGRGYVPRERDDTLELLKRHLVEQASRRLPQDQTLAISVTDVDLAGDYPRRGVHEVRVVKDIYPPRIELRFRLTAADGKIVKEGERKLRDNAFLMGVGRYANDSLRYEKTLLDGWLDDDFGRPPKR